MNKHEWFEAKEDLRILRKDLRDYLETDFVDPSIAVFAQALILMTEGSLRELEKMDFS